MIAHSGWPKLAGLPRTNNDRLGFAKGVPQLALEWNAGYIFIYEINEPASLSTRGRNERGLSCHIAHAATEERYHFGLPRGIVDSPPINLTAGVVKLWPSVFIFFLRQCFLVVIMRRLAWYTVRRTTRARVPLGFGNKMKEVVSSPAKQTP